MISEIIMGYLYSDTRLMSSLSAVSVSSNPSVFLNRRINFLAPPFAAEVVVLHEISSSTMLFHHLGTFRSLVTLSLRNEGFGVFC
jgi:hypothetical protein